LFLGGRCGVYRSLFSEPPCHPSLMIASGSLIS
jgi:hypothetical protein